MTVSLRGVDGGEGLEPLGATEVQYSSIGVGERSTFRIRTHRDGTYRLTLAAVGTYNPVNGTVDIVVGAPGRKLNWPVVVPLAVLILLGLVWALQPAVRKLPRLATSGSLKGRPAAGVDR